MIKPILYKKAKTGKVTSWFISTDGPTVITEAGYVDGIKTHHTYEAKPKNLGKKNSTTAEEQAELECAAKWEKQLKSKYVTNESGETLQRLPQKVGVYQDLFKTKKTLDKLDLPCYAEYKYNGVNGTFRLVNNVLQLTSRGGEQFIVPPHFIEPITTLLNLFNQESFNVELYIHGFHLQDIQSCVTKHNRHTHLLKAVIFNLPDFGKTYEKVCHIKEEINTYLQLSEIGCVKVSKAKVAYATQEIDDMLKEAIEHQYEGLIVTNPTSVYTYNQRSSSCWKYKIANDGEFLVVGYVLDKKGNPTLICESSGGSFKVRPKGTQESRDTMLTNIEDYIGKWYKIEYEVLSKSGKPTKPIGVGLRPCTINGEPLV